MPRRQYFDLYGPTVGDRVRLADTELYIEVERDLLTYGDEAVFGGGKTIRDGMGQDSTMTNANGALDLVITNVIVLDPVLGVLKADIGIKGGRIVDIGKAGNPKTMHGVSPKLVIGAGTEVISGEHLIATPAAIDTHIHLISPQQVYHALSNGTTTFIGGGTGPADGTNATTCTPGPWNMARMLQAIEGWPINVGLLGKGASSAAPLREQIEAGAVGFKDHEDWGATPAVIDASLQVADEYDVQVSLHSDTLNESGFLEDTIAAIGGRAIHSYHTEGAGGGHAPDIIAIAGEPNVLPASTNPTRPYTVNTLDEHLDMLIVCHHLNASVPEDVAFAESRIRAETIAAEDVLHDWGVLSMYSSDSQAMGRVGETFTRLIQTADKMKKLAGKLPEDSPRHDNFRVLRYLAKLTINPAIAHGISHVVGSLQPGKLADIILWSPAFFAAKPKMVIKGGLINWSLMGDPNASIPTPQPVYYRPMFGTLGKALPSTCVTFVSQAAYELGIREKLQLERIVEPVRNCRAIGKADMVRNDKTPHIEVNPETYEVRVDGQRATVAPAKELALTQRYFLT